MQDGQIKGQTKKKQYVCIDIEMCELTAKQRRTTNGLRNEVIQIGAVMLDERYNLISTFSTLVKPTYGSITDKIEELTGITDDMIQDADDLITAFDRYTWWLSDADVTTYCWSPSDYNQLWNEISLKARHRTDLLDVLKTFVDLQKSFGDILGARNSISLQSAIRLSGDRFEGQMHTALSDAYNTAKILHRLCCSRWLNPLFEPLYLTARQDVELYSRKTKAAFKENNTYNTSMASFMSPELLARFGLAQDKKAASEAEPSSGDAEGYEDVRRKPHRKSRAGKSLLAKYDVSVKAWVGFRIRGLFAGAMSAA